MKDSQKFQHKNCYLCGEPALKPLALKASFTAHALAHSPQSDKMCDRCHKVVVGEWQQCWYWNEGKKKWSKLWSRNWSWLWQGEQLLFPCIEGERTEGKDALPIVQNLPTRSDIRGWLLNPPEPPFTIAIAISGQKHILPWAKPSASKLHFSVQFELDTLYVSQSEFCKLLLIYQSLMELGFSKTEIDSGQYRSDRLIKVLGSSNFWDLEGAITPYRQGRLLQLVAFVA